ncbi:hypothetical protein LK459_07565 [Gordonia otitidis]|uniref:hypothetical protein n=1 Tax=Gordonia otitidis TaxID=249058 RepID=UPI001D148FC1|nr:hypothetical protein [Gordonia otitidis]UEA60680.1 hypothetical protein LK459_07565 [Gordonia otitidis]
MSDSLTTRQGVPLTVDELDGLRGLAREHGITPGLLARALLLWASQTIPPDDLAAVVDDARDQAADRASAAGATAIAARWAATPGHTEKEQ